MQVLEDRAMCAWWWKRAGGRFRVEAVRNTPADTDVFSKAGHRASTGRGQGLV